MAILQLVPAYGRKYGTVAAAKADFDGGMDFRCNNGPWHGSYTSIRDLEQIKKEGYSGLSVCIDTACTKSYEVAL